MTTPWAGVAASVNHNVDLVLRLLRFDRDIVVVAVGVLHSVVQDLEQRQLNSLIPRVENRAQVLTNLSVNESLKPQYDAMFNQCVVLLVSYFSSGLHRLFCVSVAEALRSGAELPVRDAKLTLSWRSLEGVDTDRERLFADLLVAQEDISFQDMASVTRAFKEHLSVEMTRGAATDNIILGQAARHAIVHAGARVDERMVKQLRGVRARTLKPQIVVGEALRFDPAEIGVLADSMREYVRGLCEALDERFGLIREESA